MQMKCCAMYRRYSKLEISLLYNYTTDFKHSFVLINTEVGLKAVARPLLRDR